MIFLQSAAIAFLGTIVDTKINQCSSYTVDNPDIESEIVLLKQYAPNLPDHTLR
jgi:hypothetical protein